MAELAENNPQGTANIADEPVLCIWAAKLAQF
jgi:hypothetical protein